MEESSQHPAGAAGPPASGAPAAASSRVPSPLLVGGIIGAVFVVAFTVALLRRGPASAGAAAPAAAPAGGAGTSAIMGPPPAREGEPAVISPAGSVPHGTLILTWRPVAGVEEYEAVIYDNLGGFLWTSGRLRGDSVEIPRPGEIGVTPGPTYFWRVIGRKPDGSEVRSASAQFSLRP